MTPKANEDAAASFDPLRPRLVRVAYRMLGSVADAEDAVQEAFIRWMGADRAQVREPEAFLRRTVTRLCLDELKSARHNRETYVGPWLPDPIVEASDEAGNDFTQAMAVGQVDHGRHVARHAHADPPPGQEPPDADGRGVQLRATKTWQKPSGN